jgi:hypothetical protein
MEAEQIISSQKESIVSASDMRLGVKAEIAVNGDCDQGDHKGIDNLKPYGERKSINEVAGLDSDQKISR